jgi:hypothetical protein
VKLVGVSRATSRSSLTQLLSLLRHFDDAVSNDDNLSLGASLAAVAAANAITTAAPADATRTRPGCAVSGVDRNQSGPIGQEVST